MAGRPDEQAVPLWRRIPARLPELPAGTAKITLYLWHHRATQGRLPVAGTDDGGLRIPCPAGGPARVEKHLTLLPLTTLLENLTGLYVPLLTGACSRIPPWGTRLSGSSKLDPAALAHALLRWPSHSLVLVPELLRLLLALCLNTLPWRHSSAPCASSPWAAARSPRTHRSRPCGGLPVYEGYGLSECGSVVALNGPHGDRPGSVGLPCPTAR